ncbi:MAG TPA: LOG family protein [Phycisphaerales bacterium]|nr:LOG family protein [Phycisphaerales bacterium]
MSERSEQQQPVSSEIASLIRNAGGDPESFEGRRIADMIYTSLKLIVDGHDTGQIKLMNSALKEMRYAYRVFNRFRSRKKITIFGSARTPESHPDYAAAREFGTLMAKSGWMAITGAGNGIMKAGHEGPTREASFGLSIRLPFETTANTVIEGDAKLINFRYFFTRKLMFMTHADAVAIFPGGFGTHDELYECLTLVQTGKSNIVPIVLVEGVGGSYWREFDEYNRNNMLAHGWISPEDTGLYRVCATVEEAHRLILHFYALYHSSRYVNDLLVIRLQRPLAQDELEILNHEFKGLVKEGVIEQRQGALEGERDHADLPRLVFVHTRSHFGKLRQLIDRLNSFASNTAVSSASSGEHRA